MREFRKERSLAEGKSGETTMSSSVEVEKPAPRPIRTRNFAATEGILDEDAEVEGIDDETEIIIDETAEGEILEVNDEIVEEL